MDQNSKPVLALPHGQAKISSFGQHSFEATRESLLEAPLGRINECLGDDSFRGHGESLPSEAFTILNANDSMHSKHSQHPVLVWAPKALGESVSWAH